MKYSFTVLALCLMSVASADESWPAFQNGGSIVRERQEAFELGDIQWEAELQGYGQSSPIVWEDRIYLTTVEGDSKDQYHVTAYQLSDGAELWQQTVANASPRENNSYVSRAAPSPVADAEGVICLFEGGNIIALAHDGAVRWERNLVESYGGVEARHGLSASLEQDTDSVFVWMERAEEPYVVCLSKASGDEEWKSAGPGATSWSSPRLVSVEGGQHLVLSASGMIVGVDPETGERLWSFDEISGNTTPTPMPLGGGRFLIGASAGRGSSGGTRAPESNGVVQISRGDDGTWSAAFAWHAERATSSFGSPIVYDDMAFFVNRAGVLYGLKADTGEEIFAKRLKGSIWATPITVGQQVFFFGRDGKVSILDRNAETPNISTWDGLPEPPKTAEPEGDTGRRGPPGASGPVLYAAAWCENVLVLRRGDRLFAVNVESRRD